MLEFIPIDGSLLVGIGGFLCAIALAFYNLWTRVERIERDLYGSEMDSTREGLIEDQHESHRRMMHQLDELERRMEENHDELSRALNDIIRHMDDPPPDVGMYGPFSNSNPNSDDRSDRAGDD